TGSDLHIGADGQLGAPLLLPAVQAVSTPNNTTTVAPEGLLELLGGSLSANQLVIQGQTRFDGGAIEIPNNIDITAGGRLLIAPGRSMGHDGALNNAGRLELLGGGARLAQGPNATGALNNTGLLTGDGQVDLPLDNRPGGDILAGAGQTLFFTRPGAANAGLLRLDDGNAEFGATLTNAAGGRIAGRGTLKTNSLLTNFGSMHFSAGLTDVFGPVNNDTGGQIIASGFSTATFFDDFTHEGAEVRVSEGSAAVFFGDVTGSGPYTGAGDVFFEGDVFPGSSPAAVSFGGDLTFGPAATLTAEIGGTVAGAQHDQINVARALTLGGELHPMLINGYVPGALDTFSIATFETLTGDFETTFYRNLDNGLLLVADIQPTRYDLVAAIPGDFTLDGDVGVPDLITWAQNFGAIDASFQLGDADLDTAVGVPDLIAWAQRFGQTAADYPATPGTPPALSALASATAIPEPSSLTMVCVAAMGLVTRRRRGSSRSIPPVT
ncbi:MAG: PEP-CTERM sorting domain-containing protein, partial [Planctomycetota bacterium]